MNELDGFSKHGTRHNAGERRKPPTRGRCVGVNNGDDKDLVYSSSCVLKIRQSAGIRRGNTPCPRDCSSEDVVRGHFQGVLTCAALAF